MGNDTPPTNRGFFCQFTGFLAMAGATG